VGIVSLSGTRNNDGKDGLRGDDPHYVNVGMVGQVPVFVTQENGDIKPGDALTLSTRLRGRVTKATGPARIVGYATTHFPYVEGEKDYLDDAIHGGPESRLKGDHVMCYLNVGWYAPTAQLGDGEEPEAVETAQQTQARLGAIHTPEVEAANRRTEAVREEAARRADATLHEVRPSALPPPVAVEAGR
jgi:hypothetical protein